MSMPLVSFSEANNSILVILSKGSQKTIKEMWIQNLTCEPQTGSEHCACKQASEYEGDTSSLEFEIVGFKCEEQPVHIIKYKK